MTESSNYTAMRWPWRIKVTRTDGTILENDYADDFDAPSYARWASGKENVARVDLSVAFVDGEPVSPAVPAQTGDGGS